MTDLLQGQDIAALLRSEGPVVKCVLLRATNNDDEDRKQPAKSNNATKRDVLVDWIEQVDVDTTPKKSMVAQILGGPFTFLGQYEQEGIVLMVRRPDDNDDDDHKNDSETLPLNPHKLQPPFDETEVRGDILIVRVAPTEEVLDHANDEPQELAVPSNEEFFQDYTKEEYIQFASRTDIVAPEVEEASEEEEEEVSEEEDNDEDDEEYNVAEDLGSDEEEDEQVMMMNLVMGQVLKRFREENGRGPDSEELLSLRAALAQKLGIELPPQAEYESPKRKKIVNNKDDDSAVKSILVRKRTVSTEDSDNEGDATPSDDAKRVKFSHKFSEEENVEGSKAVPEVAVASSET